MVVRHIRPPGPPQPPTIAGRPPPHDLDAERAILSAGLMRPELIDDLSTRVRVDDLYSDQHRVIWAQMLALRSAQSPVDIITLCGALRERETLSRAGGPAYVSELLEATPSVAPSRVDAYVRLIARAARKRRLIGEAQTIAAEGYGDVSESWEVDAAQRVASAAELDTDRRAVVARAWQPMPMSWLDTRPPAREYLLRYPTRDGAACPPGTGDGFLPRGKAAMLASEGGVGKTMILIQLAVSLATGHPWLGMFEADWEARKGRVLLALAEEDAEEAQRRLYTVATSLRLTQEQRERLVARLVILPLAGQPVSLLQTGSHGSGTGSHGSGTGGNLVETDEMAALRRRLIADAGEHGWSLIVLDPLARWAGPDVESDNTAATRFVQAAESLTKVPGHPTVLVAHHSSKNSRREGKADSRGVTGLTDGFRWAATLRHNRGQVLFEQTKSNYSKSMDEPITLARGVGGTLCIQSEADRELEAQRVEDSREARSAAREDAEERAIVAAMGKIQRAVAASVPGSLKSRDHMVRLVGGRASVNQAAISRLLASGAIVKGEGGYVNSTAIPQSHDERSSHVGGPANGQ